MLSHLNRSLTGGRSSIAAIALSVLLFTANARAQEPPPPPPQMCGDGVFTVNAPSGTLTLPKGCSMYLLIVSDHGRNNQLNELTFYPLAKWVAENGGYVHWAWWNNLLREYMGGPLGEAAPAAAQHPVNESEPVELQPFQKFRTNPGQPTLGYPGLIERDWVRDGAPALMPTFVLDALSAAMVNFTVPPSPPTDTAFVNDARAFLTEVRNQNQEARIFVVGHGFGAASLLEVFDGITDVPIDLVALVDPIPSDNTPAALRSDARTHRGSQWRLPRQFLGYRQADCVRNDSFPFNCRLYSVGFLKFVNHCEPQGRPADTPSTWLDSPPLISSRVPLRCSGPVIHATGALHRIYGDTPNIGKKIFHTQKESRLPISPNPTGVFNSPDVCGARTLRDPILQAIVEEGVEREGALPVPEALQDARCNPDDGHDELIGDRGALTPLDPNVLTCAFDFAAYGIHFPRLSNLADNVCSFLDSLLVKALLEHLLRPGNATGPVDHTTARVPLGSLVLGLGKDGATDTQDYLASIGRPTPVEPWPACAICENGPVQQLDARSRLPLEMAYAANAESRRQALVSMATPGPWPFQPLFPELCLVCDDLIAVAKNLLKHAAPPTAGDGRPPDLAPPTTTVQALPEPNSNGWNADATVLSLSASDNTGGTGVREITVALSGAESSVNVHSGASVETPITTEGITTVTFAARDLAGNEESPAHTLVVKIDKTVPIIDYEAAPPPNASGWNNHDVTVSFSASDELSGLAGLLPAEPIVVTTEGADQEIVGSAIDAAGNESSAGPTVSIDKTPPEIFAVPDIAPNGHGWNNTDVRVSFDASDTLSGIASSSPDSVVSMEGAAQPVQGTAEDRAGNTASASATVSIDKTAPEIAGATDIAPNSFGWNNTTVRVSFVASDALSGLAFTSPDVEVSNEGAGLVVAGSANDKADNTASASVILNIDKTSPTSEIATPGNGAVYLLNAIVNAAYGCADSLSGVSACAGAVASGAELDTATVGDKTFTVSAVDAAGNQGAASHTYSVQYAFSGFSNPIAALPAVNTANAGRTVPVKYSLRDVNGVVTSDLTSFVSLVSAPVACETNVPTAAAEETDAAGSTTIHFESGQFIYNWKTQAAWQGTCRALQLTLNDGTRHMVVFQFK